jgi:hypothetical protein
MDRLPERERQRQIYLGAMGVYLFATAASLCAGAARLRGTMSGYIQPAVRSRVYARYAARMEARVRLMEALLVLPA